MAGIPVTGIPSSFRYPGQYFEVKFGQGPSTAGGGRRTVVFVMPMTSAGTWTANSMYRVRTEQEASDGGGVGSPIHRAIRAAIPANKNAEYWCVPYAASSGGSPVSATKAFVFATTATGTGIATATVCGEDCAAVYHSGDTVTTIATAVRDAVNARTWLPVTASISSGTLTLTAKIAGASQGNGTIGQYQLRASVTVGTGVTVDSGTISSGELGDTAAGADGTTTEAVNVAAALATLVSVRRYYMGMSLFDATSLGSLKSHIAAKSDPNPGLRSRGFALYPHTKAAAATIAIGLNYERITLGWQQNGDDDVATIVGQMCACFQGDEAISSAASFDLYRGSDSSRWTVKGCYAASDRPTIDAMAGAIYDGLMPIGTDDVGSFIAMATTTRSKNPAGTQEDFQASEPHRVSIADEWGDRICARDANTWTNAILQDDQRLPDGSVNTNQRLAPVNGKKVVTPYNYEKWYLGELDQFADGHFQALQTMKDSLRVQRDPSNTGRIEVGGDLRTVDIRHQVTFALAEVSPG